MGISLLQQKSGSTLASNRSLQTHADYMTLVDKNGLIQVVPRARKSRSLSLAPLKFMLILAVLLTVFKAVALINVGVSNYEDEIALLKSGNVVEQAGAFVLQVDPVTHVIARNASVLLK